MQRDRETKRQQSREDHPPAIRTELECENGLSMAFNAACTACHRTHSEHRLRLINNLYNRLGRRPRLAFQQCLAERIRNLNIINEE